LQIFERGGARLGARRQALDVRVLDYQIRFKHCSSLFGERIHPKFIKKPTLLIR
jgi:hypothetical protein